MAVARPPQPALSGIGSESDFGATMRLSPLTSALKEQDRRTSIPMTIQSLSPVRPPTLGGTCERHERQHPTNVMREAIVLVMVGLPARGKSYISKAIGRFLRLSGVHVRSFNAGNLRRDQGVVGGAGVEAGYFSASNEEAKAEREALAMQCCDEMLEWIYADPGNVSCVAMLDATNTTVSRRQKVLARCRMAAQQAEKVPDGNPPPLRIIFIESLCDDPEILAGNYRMKLKNADYQNTEDVEAALTDFKARVHAYEEQYEMLSDSEVDCAPEDIVLTGLMRIINGGQATAFCSLGCSLVMFSICELLTCFHLTPRKIFLVSESHVDAPSVARLLRKAEREDDSGRPVDLICRASQEIEQLAWEVEDMLAVEYGDEVGEVAALPADHSMQSVEGARLPRGILTLRALEPRFGASVGSEKHALTSESFADLCERMRMAIYLIERLPRSLIVVCPDEDVQRVLLSHFHGCPEDTMPSELSVPRGPVIELQRDHNGFSLRESPLPQPHEVLPRRK